jgi:hypothetical protein
MMGFDPKNQKKKPYSPPTVTKLTPEQARQFVAERANCSDQEAEDFLESLCRELQNENKSDVVMRRIGLNRCPYCGNFEVYRSRIEPVTWLDRACVLFLLQLVRCHGCMRRHYRPLLFPAPEYPTRSAKKSAQTPANDEKWKRLA